MTQKIKLSLLITNKNKLNDTIEKNIQININKKTHNKLMNKNLYHFSNYHN